MVKMMIQHNNRVVGTRSLQSITSQASNTQLHGVRGATWLKNDARSFHYYCRVFGANLVKRAAI